MSPYVPTIRFSLQVSIMNDYFIDSSSEYACEACFGAKAAAPQMCCDVNPNCNEAENSVPANGTNVERYDLVLLLNYSLDLSLSVRLLQNILLRYAICRVQACKYGDHFVIKVSALLRSSL
jgi:hypothetical protein